MQLTLTIDSTTATADDFRRAASTLLHFGLGPGNASLTLDRVTLSGDAQTIAATMPVDVPPATPDPTTVGFGASVPSPGVGAAPSPFDPSKIEVDHDDLPHDTRIHASTRTKNKDGRWKRRKGVDEATTARVEAELRGIMSLPPPAPNGAPAGGHVPAPPAAVTATTAAPPTAPAPPTAGAVPLPPTTAATPPPPPVVAGPAAPIAAVSPTNFAQLMGWVGPAIATGKLSGETVEATMRGLGVVDGSNVGQLALLAARPDLIPGAYDALVQAAGGA